MEDLTKMSSKNTRYNNNLQYFQNIPQVKKEEEVVSIVEEPKMTHEQLHEALMWIQDTMERATIDFCVVGELGRQIIENEIPCLKANKIELAVQKKDLHEFGFSMFNTLIRIDSYVKDYKVDDNKITVKYKGVPIEILVVHNIYPFFNFPDMRCYTVTEFRFPNPFKSYWEIRGDIE